MLKMEIVIPAHGMDFDFNDARPMPFLSAPSTPKSFGDYTLSAPTSPTRMREFYRYFGDVSPINRSEESSGKSRIPFDWEEKPGTPKSPKAAANSEDDFAFSFSAELEKSSLTAEELFDGGRIRPLKPPPRLQLEDQSSILSPRSPRSPIAQGKKIIREAFSPRKKKDPDPFATAAENTRNGTENERGRGRGRDSAATSSSKHRATRSLSPFRVAAYPWEEEEKEPQQNNKESALDSKTSFSSNSSSSKGSSKKWRLKDLFLFRSASEGRASDKAYRNYPAFFRRHEDVKNASFRSTDSSGSGSGSRRKGRLSAHELHYTKNKAASEDLRKKTFLPYKQGILGRLAFNPAVHALANGFGSFTRNQS